MKYMQNSSPCPFHRALMTQLVSLVAVDVDELAARKSRKSAHRVAYDEDGVEKSPLRCALKQKVTS